MATYRIDVRFTDSTDRDDVIGFVTYLKACNDKEAAELGRQRAAKSRRPAELERVKLWMR